MSELANSILMGTYPLHKCRTCTSATTRVSYSRTWHRRTCKVKRMLHLIYPLPVYLLRVQVYGLMCSYLVPLERNNNLPVLIIRNICQCWWSWLSALNERNNPPPPENNNKKQKQTNKQTNKKQAFHYPIASSEVRGCSPDLFKTTMHKTDHGS